MSRRLKHFSSEVDTEASIDMSPLIDIVFILLIFFIVVTVFNNEPGIGIDKPAKQSSSKPLDSTSIRIAVTKTGQVYYNGRNIGVNGVRSMINSLQNSANDKLPLVIQGDRSAQHGTMMKVINAATEAGVKGIYFVTRK